MLWKTVISCANDWIGLSQTWEEISTRIHWTEASMGKSGSRSWTEHPRQKAKPKNTLVSEREFHASCDEVTKGGKCSRSNKLKLDNQVKLDVWRLLNEEIRSNYSSLLSTCPGTSHWSLGAAYQLSSACWEVVLHFSLSAEIPSCRTLLFPGNITFIISTLWVGGSVIMSAFMKVKLSSEAQSVGVLEIPPLIA